MIDERVLLSQKIGICHQLGMPDEGVARKFGLTVDQIERILQSREYDAERAGERRAWEDEQTGRAIGKCWRHVWALADFG